MTRRGLEAILRRSLVQMDPDARVAAALGARPPGARRACASVSVVAVGKAAPSMAAGALRRWREAIADVLVVTTDGTELPHALEDDRVELMHAGHPVPDRRSVVAARRCLARAQMRARHGGLMLVLVSGGASALVCAPAEGVRLTDKQAVTRTLLASGASIHELNVIRKHLSRIKGGGLARAAMPAPVMTLVISDVIRGALEDVASGPAVGDRSTVREARQLLRRYAPRFATLPLVATGPARNVVRARVIASPEELARTVARELRERGLRVRLLAPSNDPVDHLAHAYVRLAARLRPGTAIVRAAEPSLAVPAARAGRGRGGRSTHLATLVGLELPRGATFLAAATDGVDGSSGTAGAVVDATLADRASRSAIVRALDRYDTGPLHLAAGTALPRHPSGHNLADVHILVKT